MSDSTRPDITHPADLAVGTAPSQLLDCWRRHISALVNARHGIGDPLPAERIARHAVEALAVGQALAETVTRSRWITAVDALAHGAQLEHVATAMGLDVDEVAVGLRSWADGQHEHAGMSAAAAFAGSPKAAAGPGVAGVEEPATRGVADDRRGTGVSAGSPITMR